MHTATQLYPDSFQVDIDGTRSSLVELFPGWNPGDRFGIVVDSALGSLGASLLIQSAIARFYDVRPQRRAAMPTYPEVYALHIGEPRGDHSAFDFWPPRKEVVVPARRPADILAAVNTHAITRLAVPDVEAGDVGGFERGPSTWAEQQSARDRLTSCFAYDPTGRVRGSDVLIRSTDPRVEENVAATFDLPGFARQALTSTVDELTGAVADLDQPADTYRWAERVRSRASEVPESVRSELREARASASTGDVVRTETFRRISVDQALAHLAGLD